jgi:hexosaminidase
MHLDVSRHFFSVDLVKKYIDYLAYHKFNTFHWHLTDDQGWRIEIKKYPLLTSVGGYRNGTIIGRYPGKGNDSLYYGGFYTQQQIKEVIKYAADRYITVIPEIEMPGHSSAAIAAYPQLSCFPNESTKILATTPWAANRNGKQVQQTWGVFEDVYCPSEYTFNFLENVLDEVMQLFPSKYIHIGGDECPKANWKRSEFCQQLIKEKKLKDEHGLQSYFIQRIEKYVNSKGRKIIGWDEILEGGLAPNATVMSWRGEDGGIAAAREKHDVVMTPQAYCYFDHSQTKNEDSVTIGGYLPIEKVYAYDPVPKELSAEQSKYILGAQGNVWTEYIGNKQKLEYMIFPRMSALSEALWSRKEKKEWKDFERRIPALYDRFKMWGANYSNAFYNLKASILPTKDFNGVLWKLESNNKEGKIIYVKGASQNATTNYTEPVLITGNAEYGAALTRKDHTFISNWLWQKFSFNKATGKKITLKEEPSGNWTGSGAFTLVNGIITERKLEQSAEWLGFLGKDIDAVIDFGKQQNINLIRLNVLKQEGSWIYLPASVGFFISDDGVNFTSVGKQMPGENNEWKDERRIEQKLTNVSARFIKVVAKNYGIIPTGKPGAGTPAWLFADEIEVE